MIVNKVPHANSWKHIVPMENVGYAVHLEQEDGSMKEIGICIETAPTKYRLECINGRKNWVTTNILNFLIDEMVRLYEKTEEAEEDAE